MRGRGAFDKAAERFRQAARAGEVRVWGRRTPNGLFELIQPDFWARNQLNIDTIVMPFQQTMSMPLNQENERDEWAYDLQLNRGEVERIWPHA